MTTRLCFLLIFVCCACSHSGPGKNEQGIIRLRLLPGPSALAFARIIRTAPTIDGRRVEVEWAGSPEIMQAALIKKEADIAVLPLINAANLYNKGVDVRMAGCPVWGTLYLVARRAPGAVCSSGSDSLLLSIESGEPVYSFAPGTTPDILARYYFSLLPETRSGIRFNYTFPSAREVMLALLTGKARLAVLSEPFVDMALHKDSTLYIIADLNRPAGREEENTGFPQTAVVISSSMEKYRAEIDSLVRLSCRFARDYPQEAIRILEEHEVFPAGMLTRRSVDRCRIGYRTAGEASREIAGFLELVYRYEPKAVGGRMPASSFYVSRP